MKLRPATPLDALELTRAHVASWQAAYAGIVPDSFLKGFTVERRTERFRESLTRGDAETYAIEYDERIVGFLALGDCRDRDVEQQTTGEIWGIYLLPSHWRRGIGKLACEHGEAMFASRNRSIVVLWVLEANRQARGFYEAMGYKLDGGTKSVNLGTQLTAVRYRKSLKKTRP